MRTTWDVEVCRDLIAEVHGSTQLELARPTLASLAERQTYSSYHYHEYCKILSNIFDSTSEPQDVLQAAMRFMFENRWDIRHPITQASAHVMACVQSLHASLDTMALAVYYAVGLNMGSNILKEHDATLHRVISRLESNPQTTEILTQLEILQSAPTLKHLSALANQSKHRRVLYPPLGIDLREQSTEIYKMDFPEFFHQNTKYPSISAKKLLEEVQDVLSPTLVACGNALNIFLQRLANNSQHLYVADN